MQLVAVPGFGFMPRETHKIIEDIYKVGKTTTKTFQIFRFLCTKGVLGGSLSNDS